MGRLSHRPWRAYAAVISRKQFGTPNSPMVLTSVQNSFYSTKEARATNELTGRDSVSGAGCAYVRLSTRGNQCSTSFSTLSSSNGFCRKSSARSVMRHSVSLRSISLSS